MEHRISQKSQNEHGNILTDAGVLNYSKKKKKNKWIINMVSEKIGNNQSISKKNIRQNMYLDKFELRKGNKL